MNFIQIVTRYQINVLHWFNARNRLKIRRIQCDWLHCAAIVIITKIWYFTIELQLNYCADHNFVEINSIIIPFYSESLSSSIFHCEWIKCTCNYNFPGFIGFEPTKKNRCQKLYRNKLFRQKGSHISDKMHFYSLENIQFAPFNTHTHAHMHAGKRCTYTF